MSTNSTNEKRPFFDDNVPVAVIFVIIVSVQFTISIISIVSNGIVCSMICFKHNLRTNMNWFICIMSAGDTIYGMVSLTSTIQNIVWFLTPSNQTKAVCLFIGAGFLFSIRLSIGSVLCIAIERCIKIIYPLRYTDIITNGRIRLGVGLIFAYSIATTSAVWIGMNERLIINDHTVCIQGLYIASDKRIAFGSHIAPLAFASIIYGKVVSVSLKHRKTMVAIESITTHLTVDAKKRESKLFQMVGLLIVSIVLCNVPIATTLILNEMVTDEKLIFCAFSLSLAIFVCFGILNCLIYNTKDAQMRKEFINTLSSISCKRR